MFGPGCHILCMAKGVGSLFILLFVLVGAVGIGPTTFGLKGRCSTTELRPYSAIVQLYRLRATAATVRIASSLSNRKEHRRAAYLREDSIAEIG